MVEFGTIPDSATPYTRQRWSYRLSSGTHSAGSQNPSTKNFDVMSGVSDQRGLIVSVLRNQSCRRYMFPSPLSVAIPHTTKSQEPGEVSSRVVLSSMNNNQLRGSMSADVLASGNAVDGTVTSLLLEASWRKKKIEIQSGTHWSKITRNGYD